MRLFILIGAPGVGKTWLCERLSNHFHVVSSDRFKNKLDDAVEEALKQDKPVLVDIPFRIKAFIERWRAAVPDAYVVALVEDEDVHRQRIESRGGKFNDTIVKRIKRIDSLSKRYANLIGASDHLLKRLIYESVKIKLGKLPEDNMVIYKATSPSGRIYIGQTRRNLKYRVWAHYYSAIVNEASYPFMLALSKYLNDFSWEILHKAETKEELNEKETQFIEELRSNDPDKGYNCTSGGPGWSGMKLSSDHPFNIPGSFERIAWNKGRKGVQPAMTDEHKLKLIAANIGRRPSELHMRRLTDRNASGWQSDPEIRKKISEANKGLKLTEEQLKRLSKAVSGENNGMYGKTHSEETKKKMSDSKKNLMKNDEFKLAFRKNRSKYQIISPSGEVFLNDRDAASKTGIGRSKIRKLVEDSSSGWLRVEKP